MVEEKSDKPYIPEISDKVSDLENSGYENIFQSDIEYPTENKLYTDDYINENMIGNLPSKSIENPEDNGKIQNQEPEIDNLLDNIQLTENIVIFNNELEKVENVLKDMLDDYNSFDDTVITSLENYENTSGKSPNTIEELISNNDQNIQEFTELKNEEILATDKPGIENDLEDNQNAIPDSAHEKSHEDYGIPLNSFTTDLYEFKEQNNPNFPVDFEDDFENVENSLNNRQNDGLNPENYKSTNIELPTNNEYVEIENDGIQSEFETESNVWDENIENKDYPISTECTDLDKQTEDNIKKPVCQENELILKQIEKLQQLVGKLIEKQKFHTETTTCSTIDETDSNEDFLQQTQHVVSNLESSTECLKKFDDLDGSEIDYELSTLVDISSKSRIDSNLDIKNKFNEDIEEAQDLLDKIQLENLKNELHKDNQCNENGYVETNNNPINITISTENISLISFENEICETDTDTTNPVAGHNYVESTPEDNMIFTDNKEDNERKFEHILEKQMEKWSTEIILSSEKIQDDNFTEPPLEMISGKFFDTTIAETNFSTVPSLQNIKLETTSSTYNERKHESNVKTDNPENLTEISLITTTTELLVDKTESNNNSNDNFFSNISTSSTILDGDNFTTEFATNEQELLLKLITEIESLKTSSTVGESEPIWSSTKQESVDRNFSVLESTLTPVNQEVIEIVTKTGDSNEVKEILLEDSKNTTDTENLDKFTTEIVNNTNFTIENEETEKNTIETTVDFSTNFSLDFSVKFDSSTTEVLTETDNNDLRYNQNQSTQISENITQSTVNTESRTATIIETTENISNQTLNLFEICKSLKNQTDSTTAVSSMKKLDNSNQTVILENFENDDHAREPTKREIVYLNKPDLEAGTRSNELLFEENDDGSIFKKCTCPKFEQQNKYQNTLEMSDVNGKTDIPIWTDMVIEENVNPDIQTEKNQFVSTLNEGTETDQTFTQDFENDSIESQKIISLEETNEATDSLETKFYIDKNNDELTNKYELNQKKITEEKPQSFLETTIPFQGDFKEIETFPEQISEIVIDELTQDISEIGMNNLPDMNPLQDNVDVNQETVLENKLDTFAEHDISENTLEENGEFSDSNKIIENSSLRKFTENIFTEEILSDTDFSLLNLSRLENTQNISKSNYLTTIQISEEKTDNFNHETEVSTIFSSEQKIITDNKINNFIESFTTKNDLNSEIDGKFGDNTENYLEISFTNPTGYHFNEDEKPLTIPTIHKKITLFEPEISTAVLSKFEDKTEDIFEILENMDRTSTLCVECDRIDNFQTKNIPTEISDVILSTLEEPIGMTHETSQIETVSTENKPSSQIQKSSKISSINYPTPSNVRNLSSFSTEQNIKFEKTTEDIFGVLEEMKTTDTPCLAKSTPNTTDDYLFLFTLEEYPDQKPNTTLQDNMDKSELKKPLVEHRNTNQLTKPQDFTEISRQTQFLTLKIKNQEEIKEITEDIFEALEEINSTPTLCIECDNTSTPHANDINTNNGENENKAYNFQTFTKQLDENSFLELETQSEVEESTILQQISDLMNPQPITTIKNSITGTHSLPIEMELKTLEENVGAKTKVIENFGEYSSSKSMKKSTATLPHKNSSLGILPTLLLLITTAASQESTTENGINSGFETEISNLYVDLPIFNSDGYSVDNTQESITFMDYDNIQTTLKTKYLLEEKKNYENFENNKKLNSLEQLEDIEENATKNPIKLPKNTYNTEFIKCDRSDFLENNKCLCSIDDFLQKIGNSLNIENFDITSLGCKKFFKPKNDLLVGNITEETVTRQKRSHFFLKNIKRKTDGTINYHNIEELSNEDMFLLNTAGKIYSLPYGDAEIPCFIENQHEESNYYKYEWHFENHEHPRQSKIEKNDGTLTLRKVNKTMSGTYMCYATPQMSDNNDLEVIKHIFLVILPPIYHIKTNVFYSMNKTCDFYDGDIVANSLPSMFSEILCGTKLKLCNIEVHRPMCVDENNIINVTFVTKFFPLKNIFENISPNRCNINCRLSIIKKLLVITLRNINSLEKLSLMLKSDDQMIELEPKSFRMSGFGTKMPLLTAHCAEGYGMMEETPNICVVCPRNEFNPGNWSRCRRCAPGHYQPALGSRNCMQCISPLSDAACLNVLYSNTEYFKLYVAVAFGVAFLILCLILIFVFRKPRDDPNETYRLSKQQTHLRSKLNGNDFDLEQGATIPLLNLPPPVPPPDF